MPPLLIAREAELRDIAERCGAAERIALDAEGNGLHAYRARLCTLQLAWREANDTKVAIVDALALVARLPEALALLLGSLLGERGPIKVVHDLTFDARLLGQAGIQLARVRDTSVAARFLTEPATGLSALTSKHCGVELHKALQDHDWAARPLGEEELDYLAGDVRHLLELDECLARAAAALGIEAEIALESEHKLASAVAPPIERPPHERLKGYHELAPDERAAARRLCATRERIAAAEDVPPFRIAPNGILLELARRRPRTPEAIRQLCRRHEAERWAEAWLSAIASDEPIPSEPPAPAPLDRSERAARRAIERELTRWRREHALARGVDPQVIAPGHCLTDLCTALRASTLAERRAAIAAIPGFGALRVERHEAELLAIAARSFSALLAP